MNMPGENLVIKLWETITEKGIASLLTPWQITREGQARIEIRRKEMLMLAQVEMEIADIRSGKKKLHSNAPLLLTNSEMNAHTSNERIEPTLSLSTIIRHGDRSDTTESARSEINAAKAVLFAEEQLTTENQQTPNASIDEDWLFKWRENAGKVSNEDIQRLWGNILAGELKDPGKYSLRTLEFLKSISKPEAEIINKLGPYVISNCISRRHLEHLNLNGISLEILMEAQELGLISGVDSMPILSKFSSLEEDRFFHSLNSYNKALIISHENPEAVLSLEVYTLTTLGKQVLGIGSFQPDLDYMKLIGMEFVKQSYYVWIADYKVESSNTAKAYNLKEIKYEQPPYQNYS